MVKDMIFGTVGGLGLFLFGMGLMCDGLKKVAGRKLKALLETLTKRRVVADPRCGWRRGPGERERRGEWGDRGGLAAPKYAGEAGRVQQPPAAGRGCERGSSAHRGLLA